MILAYKMLFYRDAAKNLPIKASELAQHEDSLEDVPKDELKKGRKMQLTIAVIAGIIIVIAGIVAIYFAWRGYKAKNELFPFILSICALPVLIFLAGIIIHKNL